MELITQLISIAISILIGVGGTYWLIVKRYIRLLKEAADVLYALYDAMEDDDVTEEEVSKIISEAREFISMLKAKNIG